MVDSIVATAIRCRTKQETDTSDLVQQLMDIDARIAEEMRNTDDDEPDFIVDSYYQDGSNGDPGGFGGGWLG